MPSVIAQGALVAYVVIMVPYLVLQAVFAEAHRRHGHTHPARGEVPPGVDVIVACFNECVDTLLACLGSLAAQRFPGSFRVHLVDDGSADRAPAREAFALTCTVRVRALATLRDDSWETRQPTSPKS